MGKYLIRKCRPRVCGGRPYGTDMAGAVALSAPRMRGSSLLHPAHRPVHAVGPAYAGVVPATPPPQGSRGRRPRVCGGRPVATGSGRFHWKSAPRMRGSSLVTPDDLATAAVGPAYAGVVRTRGRGARSRVGRPRVCGGRPMRGSSLPRARRSAPRMRGSSVAQLVQIRGAHVGPAYAGVVRARGVRAGGRSGRPRVCGGRPAAHATARAVTVSAPRMRGSSQGDSAGDRAAVVGPAYAGVVPRGRPRAPWRRCRPRVCGGRPAKAERWLARNRSAPRMRGSSRAAHRCPARRQVGPAYAGVVRHASTRAPSRMRRPRVCGGRPLPGRDQHRQAGSAPRMRGSSVLATYRHAPK